MRFDDRFQEIVGHSREDLLRMSEVSQTVHPEDRDAYRAEMTRVARSGETSTGEWRHLRSDGSLAWVTSRVQRPTRSSVASEMLVVTVQDTGARKDAEHVLGVLTPREQEVLGMICQGLNNRAIALAMFVSHHTVKPHVQGILRRLEVRERRRAAERVAASDTFGPPRLSA